MSWDGEAWDLGGIIWTFTYDGFNQKRKGLFGKKPLISLESVKVKPFFICSYIKESDSLFSLYKEYLFTLSIGNSSPKLLHMSNDFSFNLPLKVITLAYQGSI